jgi:cell division protein FtsL
VIADNEAPEVAAEAPPAKPKLTLVVVLSMLLGILLTLMLAGGVVYYQKSKAVQAQLLAASEQLKEKTQALEEMKEQIEVLSKQMHLLKEYSIARSSPVGEKRKKPEEPATVLNAADGTPPKPMAEAAETPTTTPAIVPPKVRKPKPKSDAQNCELVGKSPEEQAATLQRCVGAMDGGKVKPRSP